MTISLAIALFAAASSTSATPADRPAADAPVVTEAKPVKPKKVCKSIAVTGSRLGKRECKTQEQWEMGEGAMELGQKGAKGSLAPPQVN
jgi:hypothetical protein